METVLLTGGLGASGRWIADRLAGEYEVVVVDREHPGLGATPADGLRFRAADLTDRGEALDVVAGADPDAVVHWPAIPVADTHPDGRVFANNALATHNVLDAAGRAGARVVQASSDGAYGFFFAEGLVVPDELPVTEAHPLRPEDPYGLSKVTAEAAGATVARREGVSVASLRPTWIQYPGDYACRADGYVSDPTAGAGNFWSYVDVRDVAELVAAALDDPPAGHESFNCAAADNALGRPLADLLSEVHGAVPDGPGVEGGGSAYALGKAERLLGWTPAHSWRDAADADVPEPTLYN
jgi:nucleoside-diphosphate-sugar epimerase